MSTPSIEIRSEAVADAVSMADWSKPASSIENSASQQALADSLLDAPIIGDHRNPNWLEQTEDSFENDEPLDYESSPEQEQPEPADLDELGQRLRDEYDHNQLLNEAEAHLNAQQNQPQAPATAQQVYAGIEQLDHATEASGLKEPGQWQPMVEALTSSFGADPSCCDGPRLGSALGKCLQSAADLFIQRNGDLTGLGPIHPISAREFASEVLGAFGGDASEADAQGFSQVMLGATLSLLQTAEELGPYATVDRMVNPANAQAFVDALFGTLGAGQIADPATAMHLARNYAAYVLQGSNRISASNQRQPRQQSASRQVQRQAHSWNEDVFGDPEVMERLRLERL